jgi:hypothetical protein
MRSQLSNLQQRLWLEVIQHLPNGQMHHPHAGDQHVRAILKQNCPKWTPGQTTVPMTMEPENHKML